MAEQETDIAFEVGGPAEVDAQVVKLFKPDASDDGDDADGEEGPDAVVQDNLPGALADAVAELIDRRDLGASLASVEAFVPLPGAADVVGDAWVVLVGAGAPDDLDLDGARKVASAAARAVKGRNVGSLGFHLGGPLEAADEARSVVEGVHYGVYEGDRYKDDPAASSVDRVCLLDGDGVAGGAAIDAAVAGAGRIGRAVTFARDLVNEPPSRLTPTILADRAVAMAKAAGLDAEVFDEARLETMGCGGILGVSSGSQEPPRMVVLRHRGDPAGDDGPWLALVGKGVTFDSGGLSIKSSEGMQTMKTDMSGAAAVLGAMRVIGEEDLPVNVVGVCPMSENLPGERPLKPGDVIEILNGKTVEVLNTDAEGRLLLADALSWCVDQGVDRIVDAATLTGSVIVALGKDIAGCFGDPGEWRDEVLAAAGRAGERAWAMPTPDDYAYELKSDIADVKNIGNSRYGGATIAALFLRHFVGDTPWAHLDIAGTARMDEGKSWSAKGGTGAAVRTFVQLARDRADDAAA